LIISLGLALLNRTSGGAGVDSAGRQLSNEAAGSNWLDDELGSPDADAAGGAGGVPEAVPEPEPAASGQNP
jgi:hypothetical protein